MRADLQSPGVRVLIIISGCGNGFEGEEVEEVGLWIKGARARTMRTSRSLEVL